MIATARGNLDVVKLLVENGANINATAFIPLKPEGRFGFHYDYMEVFSKNRIKIHTIPAYFSALVAAVYEDEPEILRYLLQNGADVNVKDHTWMALFNPVFNGKEEIVKILLKKGIDVNKRGVLGSTVLHIAVEKDNIEMAKLLINYGADGNLKDNFGWTPLHVAALFSRNVSNEMIELLLDNGCYINALTDGGYSPLNLVEAGYNHTFLSFLARNFHNLDHIKHKETAAVDSDKDLTDIIVLFVERGADIDHRDGVLGWTTLHWAAASGDLRAARVLVENYAAMTTRRSKLGWTPYKTAVHFGRKGVSEFLNPDRNLVS